MHQPMVQQLINLNNYKTLISDYIREYNLFSIDQNLFYEKIDSGITKNMGEKQLAFYCSEQAASMLTYNMHYGKLAAVILVSYHSATTLDSFTGKLKLIKQNTQVLNQELYDLVMSNREEYDSIIDYSRDFNLSFFSINSLMRSYMIRIDDELVERPQDIFLRVAIQINRDDMIMIKKTYDLISLGYYTHGTPTLFNSMLRNFQLASCFLLTPKDDSIEGDFSTIGDCAHISKFSGGIGLNLHSIRSKGSNLKTTGGISKGIIPIIRIVNETMKYVNLGGTKRQSTTAFYLEPWHKDIFDFLDVRKNTGNEELRAREIFTALWVNDLFMERVENNDNWSLFDPNEAKGLSDVWGDDFKKLYLKYEDSISRTVVRAQFLFKAIINSQIETGTPYMVYKDTSNKHSNQSNLGTIKSSNLCAEIIEYSSPTETAVCNLASICLPKFVVDGSFNFKHLKEVTNTICYNLNKVIDTGFYPTPETCTSNNKHRPMGIGIQGLADVFAELRIPFESKKAREINKLILETMYYGAIEASNELAIQFGAYDSFHGSPLSKGIFHFESYGVQPSGMWDWNSLRSKVINTGVRNSLFIALMPTAGTSQIFGNSECFEPLTSNIFTRRTVAGEFQVINTYLMNDLIKLGMWTEETRNLIIEHEGSVQKIPFVPQEIKDLYKTVWEIKMKSIIDMASDRQPYIDQSQSLNIYLSQPTFAQLSSMHFYGWKKQLKTGMYYLRTRPISNVIKFTVDQELVEKTLSSATGQDNSGSDEKQQDKENVSNPMDVVCELCSC